ncbi:hypothetical protein [Formosa sp. A9]|uniref:hypothetical protein n=1 Tax=Formosa sp. A9 TaxID=3442641 RepID=UPI003EBDC5DA
MKANNYISTGKLTTLITFLIGAFIFGMYFLTSNNTLLFVGYAYILLAAIVNVILLFAIVFKSKSDVINRKRLLSTGGLMLVNIPVMFLFIWIAMLLMNTIRINITNTTQNNLTGIKIQGCKTEELSDLKPNESKTFWIKIPGDCSITLEYLENGTLKKEAVAGYVSNGMGHKIKHNINGSDKNIL